MERFPVYLDSRTLVTHGTDWLNGDYGIEVSDSGPLLQLNSEGISIAGRLEYYGLNRTPFEKPVFRFGDSPDGTEGDCLARECLTEYLEEYGFAVADPRARKWREILPGMDNIDVLEKSYSHD